MDCVENIVLESRSMGDTSDAAGGRTTPFAREKQPMQLTSRAILAVGAALAIACGGTPTTPLSGAVVTFAVGSETLRVALISADQVAAAHAAQSGGRANSSRSSRSGRAAQYGVELASRGRHIRGSRNRAV